MEVCPNTIDASNPSVKTRGFVGSTTPELLNQVWIDASKRATGPIRDASARVKLHGGGTAQEGGARGRCTD